MELRNAISAEFNIQVPATLAFDFPTPGAIASFVASQMAASAGVSLTQLTGLPASGLAAGSQDLCSQILSVACKFPGQSSEALDERPAAFHCTAVPRALTELFSRLARDVLAAFAFHS